VSLNALNTLFEALMSWVAIVFQIVFLATGIFTTICNQLVTYSGAGEKSTLLLSAPTYVGMLMVVTIPTGVNNESNESRIRGDLIFVSALLDVVSNVICMIGLHMIGSGLFQVN